MANDSLNDVLIRYNAEVISLIKNVLLDIKPPKPKPIPPIDPPWLMQLLEIMEKHQVDLLKTKSQ